MKKIRGRDQRAAGQPGPGPPPLRRRAATMGREMTVVSEMSELLVKDVSAARDHTDDDG